MESRFRIGLQLVLMPMPSTHVAVGCLHVSVRLELHRHLPRHRVVAADGVVVVVTVVVAAAVMVAAVAAAAAAVALATI